MNLSAAWPGPRVGMGPCRVTCFSPHLRGLNVHVHPCKLLAGQLVDCFPLWLPTSLWAPQPPAEVAASLGNWLLMQGPWGASQARQTAGWRRPAPSSPATRACGSSVEQGSRHGREPRVGGRLLLGHLPWAGALCQGALAEPLQGAWRRMDALPRAPTIGPAGSREVQLWSSDLGVLAWGCSEGAQNGAQGSLTTPGPQAAAPRGLGGRKGKGDVIAAWNLLFGGVAMETGRLRVGKNSKPKRV